MNSRWFHILLFSFTLALLGWWMLNLLRLSNRETELTLMKLKLQFRDFEKELLLAPQCEQGVSFLYSSKSFTLCTAEWNRLLAQYPELKMTVINHQLTIWPEENMLAAVLQRRKNARHWLLAEGGILVALLCVGYYQVYKALKASKLLNERQNNFIMAVTHELKTPIAAVRLSLQTINRLWKNQDSLAQRILMAGVEETERLNDLVENILQSTRLESASNLVLETVSVAEFVEKMYERYKQRFGHQYEFDLNIGRCPEVKMNPELMELAFSNLISNAMKYSECGSRVVLSALPYGEKVKIAVEDEGVGIPKEHEKRIFEKFYRIGDETRRHSKGSGLGLFLVNEILRIHKGQVRLVHKKKGTIFQLLIPIES